MHVATTILICPLEVESELRQFIRALYLKKQTNHITTGNAIAGQELSLKLGEREVERENRERREFINYSSAKCRDQNIC